MAEWLCSAMHEINSIRTESNTNIYLFVSLNFLCIFPFAMSSISFDNVMFAVNISTHDEAEDNRVRKREKSICMTTIRWHKNVNTVKSICIVCIFVKSLRQKKNRICKHLNGTQNDLAFYWKVLNFLPPLTLVVLYLSIFDMASHLFILAAVQYINSFTHSDAVKLCLFSFPFLFYI